LLCSYRDFGLGLDPRSDEFFNRNAVRRSVTNEKRTQPPCGWESNQNLLPRVAEAATLGWRAQPRCGSPLNERLVSNLTQVHQASTYKEFIFLPRTQLPAHS